MLATIRGDTWIMIMSLMSIKMLANMAHMQYHLR